MCRRGMKELDDLLLGYLERAYDDACVDEQAAFRELLEWPDPALHELLCGRRSAEGEAMTRVVRHILEGSPNAGH